MRSKVLDILTMHFFTAQSGIFADDIRNISFVNLLKFKVNSIYKNFHFEFSVDVSQLFSFIKHFVLFSEAFIHFIKLKVYLFLLFVQYSAGKLAIHYNKEA